MKKAQATALLTVLGLVGTLTVPALADKELNGGKEKPKASSDKELNGGKDKPKAVNGKEVKKAGKQGADSACGEGSCGTDDKGAAAAKKAHDKAQAKAPAKDTAKESGKAKGK